MYVLICLHLHFCKVINVMNVFLALQVHVTLHYMRDGWMDGLTD